MEELIELLRDGKSRTVEMMAIELNTTVEKIRRDIEFLEHTGVIKKVDFQTACGGGSSCDGCTSCGTGSKSCQSCMPKEGFQNMGTMWEI
ncbi:MAG: DeoR family transcriptional regulator [Eubacterium sp.]|nr:DeoR family transcriptional regulator [Eubacterium sp.]